MAFDFQAAGNKDQVMAQLTRITQDQAQGQFGRKIAALLAERIITDELFEHSGHTYVYTIRAEGSGGGGRASGTPTQLRIAMDSFWVPAVFPYPMTPTPSVAQMQAAPVMPDPPATQYDFAGWERDQAQQENKPEQPATARPSRGATRKSSGRSVTASGEIIWDSRVPEGEVWTYQQTLEHSRGQVGPWQATDKPGTGPSEETPSAGGFLAGGIDG